ncbi:MAG: glycoside hydrolase family 20 zincin-like fold domain-containing protein [Phycisphaerae bacterium]|nr:glycoside hydrolase family 20 zincin-like fold domain-containing protein [Phycisphaerae bacterium]
MAAIDRAGALRENNFSAGTMAFPSVSTFRAMLLAMALVASVSCDSARAGETRQLGKVVAEYMTGDLETAIIPTPQKAQLKDTVFAAGKVLLVKPDRYGPPDTLDKELTGLLGKDNVTAITVSSFLRTAPSAGTIVLVGDARRNAAAGKTAHAKAPAKLNTSVKSAGPDAYILLSAAGKGDSPNVVVLGGNSPAGDFWALCTLRQMVFRKDGVSYIREGQIADFPRFRLRGNKRPRQWEWRYKANYGWFFAAQPKGNKSFRAEYFRTHGTWVHYGNPLRATDEEMDKLVAGYDEVAVGEKKPKHRTGAAEYYRAGCREFVLKFDDSGSKMSPATAGRFGKSGFFKALHHFLTGMHKRIKRIDPGNRIYFMPRPYYANSFELASYAKALASHGPLPEDMGLSVCGPEVISRKIPTGCLKEFRVLFGLKLKAQIYDNHGRGGDYFACRGRSAELWKEVDCLFPERGTPVTRITVYDYLWNPGAYDPKRSLLLAVRELASGRPKVYAPLRDYILYWNQNRWPGAAMSRREAVEHFGKTNRTLKAKYEALAPVLDKSPLALELKLTDELWGARSKAGSFEWGEYARLRRRLEFEPYMSAFGWREGRVARTVKAPTIDGRLDEKAWSGAHRSAAFVRPVWSAQQAPRRPDDMKTPPEESTTVRLLYTRTHLYIGIDFAYKTRPQTPDWAKKLWKDVPRPGQGNLAWRAPCFELFIDPTGRREDYRQIVANIAGVWLSKHFGAYKPGEVPQRWRPDFKFAFELHDHRGTFEASVPLADLTDTPPASGRAWAFQCFRSKIGSFSVFSGVFDLVGGEHAASQFGRIVFE